MFLTNVFNKEQKKAFLRLMKKFIMADGIIQPEERNAMELLIMEITVSEEDMNLRDILNEDIENVSIDRLLDPFRNIESQRAIILQLFIMGYADEKLSLEENEFIDIACLRFGISPQERDKLKNWVIKEAQLIEELIDIWQ